MTKTIAVAAAVLLGTVAFANAAEKAGASKMSPGQETQSSTTNTPKSASDNETKNKGTVGMSRGSHKGSSGNTSAEKTKNKY